MKQFRSCVIHYAAAIAIAIAIAMLVASTALSQSAPSSHEKIRIVDRKTPDAVMQYRRSLAEGRPALRGFRAPILDCAGEPWPINEPAATAPRSLQEAAELVGQRLARDGLLVTAARVAELYKVSQVANQQPLEAFLRQAGIPTDLLMFFALPEGPTTDGAASTDIIAWLVDQIAAGQTAQALAPLLARSEFRFQQSQPGYRVATESGEHEIGMLRLQMTRGSYWTGQGDGGNLDLTRQLVEQLPSVDFLVSVERKFLDEFLRHASAWPLQRAEQLTVVVEDMTVSQWAQDNGKPGIVHGAQRDHVAILVPRYASRGEDGSTFAPGESFLADGLAAAGQIVVQSPLLFQGGNLLAVEHPRTGERLLLIGEAEIYRNTALGLTREQAIEAFRIEFGVDRCDVLASVCFHIDYDLCVRAHGGRLIAFVNDTMAAVKIILQCSVDALEAKQVITAEEASVAREHLNAGRLREFLIMIGDPVLTSSDHVGHFPLSLAEVFSVGPQDSAVGNFQRFLLALDIAASQTLQPGEMPRDPGLLAYIRALLRREADRQQLHQHLAAIGLEVVPVPSLADAERSITAINGIHAAGLYVMPAYGGLYAPLDEAAAAAFADALGDDVAILPVQCSETQRRVGAVHCAASVHPRLN